MILRTVTNSHSAFPRLRHLQDRTVKSEGSSYFWISWKTILELYFMLLSECAFKICVARCVVSFWVVCLTGSQQHMLLTGECPKGSINMEYLMKHLILTFPDFQSACLKIGLEQLAWINKHPASVPTKSGAFSWGCGLMKRLQATSQETQVLVPALSLTRDLSKYLFLFVSTFHTYSNDRKYLHIRQWAKKQLNFLHIFRSHLGGITFFF